MFVCILVLSGFALDFEIRPPAKFAEDPGAHVRNGICQVSSPGLLPSVSPVKEMFVDFFFTFLCSRASPLTVKFDFSAKFVESPGAQVTNGICQVSFPGLLPSVSPVKEDVR